MTDTAIPRTRPATSPILLGGSWVAATCDEVVEVLDPATDEVVGAVPSCDGLDVDAAVAAARGALEGWRRTAPADRAAALKAWARRLRDHLDVVAEVQTCEVGKPLGDSRGGVEAGIGAIEQYAELGPLHRGRSLQGGWGAVDLMAHEPRGVAVVLTPWNDPVAIACQLLAACLVAGNTVVLKPSERAPLCQQRAVELLADLVPPGVVGVVHGHARAGAALAGHRDVDLVVHVGSQATGALVAEAAARTGAKALLELGGKDACIVDEGVDPTWAAEQVAMGAFANTGQICVSVERVYVHEAVAEPFLAALEAEAAKRVVGSPLEPATTMGPLVDRRQRDHVHRQVQAAVAAGAELRCGGEVPEGPGAFYPPTVLVGCGEELEVMREETFGPVAAVAVVPSFDDALLRACTSTYGLAATVLTPSMDHAQRAFRELPVGTVKVNAAFGGAPGGAAEPHRGSGGGWGSGRGFGYGPELLDEVTTTKVLHISPPPGLRS